VSALADAANPQLAMNISTIKVFFAMKILLLNFLKALFFL
jgi:hypothetical protein